MARYLVTALLGGALFLGGCMAGTSEEGVGSSGEALGGKTCFSSADCPEALYCTTEDGDCQSACRPNESVCILVCAGVCRPDDREQCGDVVCPAGTECCNASCGTCVEPGGFCTQEVCDSTTTL